MRRREFITLLGGAGAAWPLAARAQQPGRMRRIGVLMTVSESDPEGQARLDALRQGLNQLGWSEGKNLAIEYRWAGGDIAGFTYMEVSLIGKWLDLLKGIAPTITRTAFLFNPDTAPFYTTFLRSFESAPHPVVMEFSAAPVRTSGELEATIASLARVPGGSLIAGADASNIVHREAILRLVAQYKLPTLSAYRQIAEEGALMSYGPDSEEIFRRSASYIDRILKGEAPASLPAQAPTKFEFVINLKTAKSLGLSVPANLLALADRVIE